MSEQVTQLLQRERAMRIKAEHHCREAEGYERHANDLRLRAWRLQQREFQERFEEEQNVA